MKNHMITKFGIFVTILLTLSACQNEMSLQESLVKSGSLGTGDGGGGDGNQNIPDFEFNEAQAAADEAEQAMSEAKSLMNLIYNEDTGEIDLTPDIPDDLSGDVQSQLFGNKIKKLFDKVFGKLELVKEKIDAVKLRIQDAMAKLDSTLPGHAATLAKMQLLLDKIDLLEGKLDSLIGVLVDKIDHVLNMVNKYLAGLNPTKPAHIAILIAAEILKKPIVDFRNRLDQIFE